jgi:hypothetical protein
VHTARLTRANRDIAEAKRRGSPKTLGTTADTGKDGGKEVTRMTFTPAQLRERALHRRAVEAAVWGMPAVNFDAMYQALVRDVHGGSNQIV